MRPPIRRRSFAAVASVHLFWFLVVVAPFASAQAAEGVEGVWGGAMQLPTMELAVVVEFRSVDDALRGDIDIPAQSAKDLPLAGIALDGNFSVPAPDRRALRLDGELRDPQADLAASLEISRIVLDSNRVLAEGTRISLELAEPDGESLQLSGTCIESLPLDGADTEDLYRVSVGLDAAPDEGIASAPNVRDRTGMNLSGSLSEVAIMSLLGFFELERSPGVLSIQHESEKASIFISEGNVFDGDAAPARRSATRPLLPGARRSPGPATGRSLRPEGPR